MSEAVELRPYNPQWAADFAAERLKVIRCFDKPPLLIEHFGSTAVPGLSAKPIIDVLVLAEDMDTASASIPAIEATGYSSVSNYSNPNRLVLIKRNPNGERTHHLHVHVDADEVWRHLIFRDILRAEPLVLAAYETLKQDLASKFRIDREAYSRHKAAFIDEVVLSRGGPARKTDWNPANPASLQS